MKKQPWWAVLVVSALGFTACAPANETGPQRDLAAYQIAPADVFRGVPEVGDIGMWMITKSLENATWLGESLGGRTLREPINVIVLDRAAKTPEEATSRLLDAMEKAGYGPKNMHSDGYFGWINGRLYTQQPANGKGLAFSDAPWYRSNNHGRMFGPAKVAGGFVFTGAFSREDFKLLPKPRHTYNSFVTTREDLAEQLTAKTSFKRAGYVDLKNMLDTAAETTANHDGKAVLLVAEQ